MKKILLGAALVLAIAISVISGTLALYTTTIDSVATGSVTAKEFTLVESGTDTFVNNVKIAPTETVTWSFAVKNYNGSVVSETAMDLAFTVSVAPPAGKSAIAPLVVTIKNEAGTVVGTQTGTGTINFADVFALQATGQTHTYTVIVTWPSGSGDAAYTNSAGKYGTAISVSVTGTQK